MNDGISDMLTRIRNALRVKRASVDVRRSGVNRGIARVLQEEGYILGFDEIEDGRQGLLRVSLRYGPDGEQVIQQIRRVSKPGRRIYGRAKAIPQVMDGLGIAVLSTPQGVMSDRQARVQNLGGEILCTVC